MFLPGRSVNDEKEKQRIVFKNIEDWCLNLIETPTIREACIISVQEVVCGDPNCSPKDTVITFTFKNGGQGMLSLPMSAVEVTQEELKEIFPPEEIIEKWNAGEDAAWPPEPEPQELRFDIGYDVLCRVGPTDWVPGKVVQLWYREPNWPEYVYAPYKIQLDDGRSIFAPQDMDQIIRLNPNGNQGQSIASSSQQQQINK